MDPNAAVAIVAVDTGGTFTDVVCWRGGRLSVAKVPSTPSDPARAVLAGIARVLGGGSDDGSGAGAGESAASVPPFVLVHGSTVATNALLERRGARVGLVTNRGFEDVLEIGRQNRPQLYALVGTRPPPLVPAEDRHGVAGRIGPDGAEESPLDASELASLAARLEGVDAVAICLLHSYANPAHEQAVAAALTGLGVPLSVSSELLREYREYERTATTVVNAYVAPVMDRYLGRIEADSGARRVRIMGSGGGAVSVRRARGEPVHTVLSGPAGGVMGALHVAAAAGFEQIMTFDMGGTSTDVSLCPGRPLHTRELTIANLPVAVPVLDIHTVGAGGGSIAWVDAGGALRVGPRSAGSEPGPICYGRGGAEVTVTDAHVWLGRMPADAFLGGESRLDREAIGPALRELAGRLGLEPDAAAEGILDVVDTAMEGALRVISVERGHDPADFTLVPFGGAAGLHAVEMARRLGMRGVLVPPHPGVLSAFGMLVSPVRKDAARTVLWPSDVVALESRLEEAFRELEAEALAAMAEEAIPVEAVVLRRTLDARYRGQSFELEVPADAGWREAFHALHRARYGFDRPDAAVEIVTLRVGAVERGGPAVQLDAIAYPDAPHQAAETVVRFRGAAVRARRAARSALRPGDRLEGPAVITEYSATTWVPAGWRVEVHAGGSLFLSPTRP